MGCYQDKIDKGNEHLKANQEKQTNKGLQSSMIRNQQNGEDGIQMSIDGAQQQQGEERKSYNLDKQKSGEFDVNDNESHWPLETNNTNSLNQIRLIINKLYDKSFRQRTVEQSLAYFIQEEVDFQDLCQNYQIRGNDVKEKIKVICNGYRQVRGDGNSFYTSFGFQFLEILLIKYSDYQYNQFIQWIQNIELAFKINYQDFRIHDIRIESNLRNQFLNRLDKLRQLNEQERFFQLYEQYRAYQYINSELDGCFYGIATIFFRNLSNLAVLQSEMQELLFDKESLLIWEQKCNNNEIAISALANLLKIHIKLVLFEQQEFKVMDYCSENQHQVILLTMLGHYNIGYKNQDLNNELDFPEVEVQQDIIQPYSNNKQYELDIIRQLINKLYDLSCRKRYVEQRFAYFVREKENFQELCKNYSIRGSNAKTKLKQICNSYRQARGDGNCFYTSFGIQFLEILVVQYSDEQYNQFIQWIQNLKLPFKINYQDFQIDDLELEQKFRDEFLSRLDKIRQLNKQERFDQLFEQFRAYQQIDQELDGCFYGIATIFFRNLSNLAVEQSEMKEFLFDRQNLLLWETECNNNEIVIQALAQLLKIHIKLVFFEQQEFKVQDYSPENQYQIILLIKPGHYNIGYLEQDQEAF